MRTQRTARQPNRTKLFLFHRVIANGMSPVRRPSRLVLAVPRRRYQDEDVVLIRHNGMEKLERVRAVQGSQYEVRVDNPATSTDSRQFGLIEKQAILGKVVWPRM